METIRITYKTLITSIFGLDSNKTSDHEYKKDKHVAQCKTICSGEKGEHIPLLRTASLMRKNVVPSVKKCVRQFGFKWKKREL